jgi:hypothetical protein
VACKREHFTAETHELDAVLVVPADHLSDITRVGETQLLDISHASSNICRLFFVWAILRGVLRLGRVFQGMAMFEDTRNAASPRAEHGRIRIAQVSVETSLAYRLVGVM